ncbi:TetR/AcrR family transcriptional regulator [Paenibacillus sp. GCM10027627]|uniref:TetR/AcrR family transcriptional regulator n=1 Tax=unclassified Paenibacillus TaxID=185978 RepID=UPI00362B2B2A
MYSKFLSIDEEKRGRIINAALKEFALKGYAAASTNEIAKEAGISKGLLFHYFTSKKDLYVYLYDHTIRITSEAVANKIDLLEKDLFVRMRQLSIVKLGIFGVYPNFFEFLKSVYFEEAADVSHELQDKRKEIAASEYFKLFADIDRTKFKDGVDPNKALQIILWSLEGLGEQEREKYRKLGQKVDIDALLEQTDQYLDLFKLSFYK